MICSTMSYLGQAYNSQRTKVTNLLFSAVTLPGTFIYISTNSVIQSVESLIQSYSSSLDITYVDTYKLDL